MLRHCLKGWALLGFLLPAIAYAQVGLRVASIRQPVAAATIREDARAFRLRQQISDILKMPLLRRARVGVEILKANSGAEVLNHNADALFNPASNTKILTTAAALSTLGSDFRYRTVLLATPQNADLSVAETPALSRGILHGDVFLQGSGDPLLHPQDLATLAKNLRRAGIEHIDGAVRLDNQLRDIATLTGAAAAPSYGHGALMLNGDRYSVHVTPGELGHAAVVWVGPRQPYFVLHNLVKTVRGQRSRVLVDHERRDGQLVVTVRGRIGIKSRLVRVRRQLADSNAWVAATLGAALTDFGITVRDGVKIGPPPPGPLQVVAEYTSEPLSKICHVINKDSNNFVADNLFKTLGAARYGLPGTLEKGARAVAEWLLPLGFGPGRVHLVNGSGLTHDNRLRPADLGQLLYKLYHSLELGPEFLQSLAIGGIDGTIHHRFHGSLAGLVRGKTGTLSGVSVLSGYVGDRPGQDVMIFCIFIEGFRGRRLTAIRQAQAQIVEALMRFVRDGERPGGPAFTPREPPTEVPAAPDAPTERLSDGDGEDA